MAILRKWLAGFLLAALSGTSVLADDTADFYRGKTFNILVGYGPGGGYDLYARLLSRHIGPHIPGNPNVVVQNMPGAASLRVVNHIASQAAKDGTVIATFDMNMPLIGFLGDNPNAKFDARQFTWLGSLSDFSDDAFVLWARKDSPVRNSDDLIQKRAVLNLGVAQAGATDYDLGLLLRDRFGLPVKIVPGYPNSAAIGLALEGSEIDGHFVTYVSSKIIHPTWGRPESNIHVILQFARTTRHPALPNVPLVRELARDDEERRLVDAAQAPYRLSRPYVAPPGIPADRANALRQAFQAAAKNPALNSEAKTMSLEISPIFAAEAHKIVEDLANTPEPVLAQLRKLRETIPK